MINPGNFADEQTTTTDCDGDMYRQLFLFHSEYKGYIRKNHAAFLNFMKQLQSKHDVSFSKTTVCFTILKKIKVVALDSSLIEKLETFIWTTA